MHHNRRHLLLLNAIQYRILSRYFIALLFFSFAFGLANETLTTAADYAFLVSVQDYDVKQLTKLKYSRNDILEFQKVLLDSGMPRDNIRVLHDDIRNLSDVRYLAESKRIRSELDIIIKRLTKEDRIIVALAGHGLQFKGESTSYFCPLDADTSDKKTLISINEIYSALEDCPAERKLLLVDACRNDPQSTIARSSGPKTESVTKPQLVPPPSGVVALFSCAAGQQSFEWPELNHGLFFHFVIEAWNGKADTGDGELQLDELIHFVKTKTSAFADDELGASQTPRQRGFFSGSWALRELGFDALAESGYPLVFGFNLDFFLEVFESPIPASADEFEMFHIFEGGNVLFLVDADYEKFATLSKGNKEEAFQKFTESCAFIGKRKKGTTLADLLKLQETLNKKDKFPLRCELVGELVVMAVPKQLKEIAKHPKLEGQCEKVLNEIAKNDRQMFLSLDESIIKNIIEALMKTEGMDDTTRLIMSSVLSPVTMSARTRMTINGGEKTFEFSAAPQRGVALAELHTKYEGLLAAIRLLAKQFKLDDEVLEGLAFKTESGVVKLRSQTLYRELRDLIANSKLVK